MDGWWMVLIALIGPATTGLVIYGLGRARARQHQEIIDTIRQRPMMRIGLGENDEPLCPHCGHSLVAGEQHDG